MSRAVRPVLVAIAASLLLSACAASGPVGSGTSPHPAPDPAPDPTPVFAARQLAAVSLTEADFGAGWTLMPGIDGGPIDPTVAGGDPCQWQTGWLPNFASFSTYSARMYTVGDDITYASDWIAAAAPGADLRAELIDFEAALSACGASESTDPEAPGVITVIPEGPSGHGDASFSYRVEFTGPDGENWGLGEVHSVVCGPLWLSLSYAGLDAFVERDDLLATFVGRAAELGGC